MIKIKNLTHRYKGRKEDAIKNIDLHIKKGETVVLLGSSGSGKSTLMKCINKLIDPTSGSILIKEEDILKADIKEVERIRKKIGVIFQEFNLIERETVFKNTLNGRLGYVGVVRSFFNNFKEEDYKIVENNLRRVGLLDLKDEWVCNLSGGQKQRVAIARALSQDPEIILADEPVSNLDPKLMREIMDLLQKICEEKGITLITSLHFIELVKKYASRVVGLNNGWVVFNDHIQEMTDKDLISIYGETKDWYLYGKLGF